MDVPHATFAVGYRKKVLQHRLDARSLSHHRRTTMMSAFISGLNVYTFLTVRAICIAGLESLLAMRKDLEGKRDESFGAELTNSVYKSDDFMNLYNLMAHEDSLTPDDWFLRTLVSIFLFRCSS